MSEEGESDVPSTITGGAPPRAPERPARTSAIRVRHLFHRFGNVEVLRDVDFEVAAGEVFGFIGPNGAGKTTTIRVMATLLEPVAGRVEIDGIDVARYPDEVRRIIGYMPDHAGVYDRITVREYLEFFADAYRIRTPKVVDAVLELTDIGPLSDRLVATMSKGQKQRLQLARILLHDPKVLILDEPASDLDPRARIEIRALLGELRHLGKTVLLSSHILTELADVCTSVGIIERGHIVVSGPIEEIATRFEEQRARQQAGIAGPEVARSPATARRTVKIRVLGELDAARPVLDGAPKLVGVVVEDGAFLAEIAGGDAEVAALVRHLVEGGVGVVHVEQQRADLERLFLEATRGEMS